MYTLLYSTLRWVRSERRTKFFLLAAVGDKKKSCAVNSTPISSVSVCDELHLTILPSNE